MLIYDIEILNAIPNANEPREPDIIYCDGWNDHAGMKIAVIGCFDYSSETSRIFCQDNLTDFLTLALSHDVCVGFNNHRFDDPVLASQGLILKSTYDLFAEIQHGIGLDFNAPAKRRHGYGLSNMATANFQLKKTGDGAKAPINFQRGLIGSTSRDKKALNILMFGRITSTFNRKKTMKNTDTTDGKTVEEINGLLAEVKSKKAFFQKELLELPDDINKAADNYNSEMVSTLKRRQHEITDQIMLLECHEKHLLSGLQWHAYTAASAETSRLAFMKQEKIMAVDRAKVELGEADSDLYVNQEKTSTARRLANQYEQESQNLKRLATEKTGN